MPGFFLSILCDWVYVVFPFLLLNSIPLHDYTIICPLSCWWTFGLFSTFWWSSRQLETFSHIFSVHVHAYLMLVYSKEEFWGCGLCMSSALADIARFPRCLPLFTLPTAVFESFHWIRNFADHSYCQSSKISQFWWVFNGVSLQICLAFPSLLMRLRTFSDVCWLIDILLCEIKAIMCY